MRAVFSEIVGLFVDDGFLAVGLLAWCAAIGLACRLIPTLAPAGAPLLAGGCALVLLATVRRAAR